MYRIYPKENLRSLHYPPPYTTPTATKIIRSGFQLVYVRYCIKLTSGKSKDRILLSEVVVFKVRSISRALRPVVILLGDSESQSLTVIALAIIINQNNRFVWKFMPLLMSHRQHS